MTCNVMAGGAIITHAVRMDAIGLSAGTIEYRCTGPAGGPVLVFVHGFLVDGTVWADVPDRLGELGFRCYVPTWPMGSHTLALNPGADGTPAGVAEMVLEFVALLGVPSVTLVGNDSGGAVCQLVLGSDPARIGTLVLTNCDAFEVFPPFPFDIVIRLVRRPRLARAVLAPLAWRTMRDSPVAFGWLAKRRLPGDLTAAWVRPYLSDAAIRADVAGFAAGIRRRTLLDNLPALTAYQRPVLICWGADDRFFRPTLARRLSATFPDVKLVEVAQARTFLALDQPGRLATEIAAFLAEAARPAEGVTPAGQRSGG